MIVSKLGTTVAGAVLLLVAMNTEAVPPVKNAGPRRRKRMLNENLNSTRDVVDEKFRSAIFGQVSAFDVKSFMTIPLNGGGKDLVAILLVHFQDGTIVPKVVLAPDVRNPNTSMVILNAVPPQVYPEVYRDTSSAWCPMVHADLGEILIDAMKERAAAAGFTADGGAVGHGK